MDLKKNKQEEIKTLDKIAYNLRGSFYYLCREELLIIFQLC